MKIAVIGGGSWGTALARLLSRKEHDVSLWVYEKDLASTIVERRENPIYLPGFSLPKSLAVSPEIGEALEGAQWVLFAVPSHAARDVLFRMRPFVGAHTPIISATKGIERKSLMLVSEVICDVLRRKNADRIAVLSGPSFAKEVALEYPTAVSLATQNHHLGARVQRAFSTPFFKLLLSHDLLGVQLGGALKNVIALAAGGSDGLGFGGNTKATLMTRGLSEITRLGIALGAEVNTFYGLSGMGDLFLTCGGALSRNRQVGEEIGKGAPLSEILKKMTMVAEGVATAESAYALALKHKVETPIIREIYRVLFEGKPPRQAVLDLMKIARGDEIPLEVKPSRARK